MGAEKQPNPPISFALHGAYVWNSILHVIQSMLEKFLTLLESQPKSCIADKS
jgi:hypothetical protein